MRFRPYKQGDKNFLSVRSNSPGCWSYTGKIGEGQVVNFQAPNCVQNGVIIHEFMHALGFVHQQSAADRDEWIDIIWSNIQPGMESNFDKLDNKTITDYGIVYDYGSIMHYRANAFSINGQNTIVPKVNNHKFLFDSIFIIVLT